MRRLGFFFKSPIFSIRHYINTMSSQASGWQGCCTCRQRCQKSISLTSNPTFQRTVSSYCSSGQEKTTQKPQDYRQKEREELLWNKLSEDEKNIYFAHKHACMNGENSYVDPITGYTVFTEDFLRKRRNCCGNGCRHVSCSLLCHCSICCSC